MPDLVVVIDHHAPKKTTPVPSKGKWARRFGAIALALAAGCGSDSGHESASAASFHELRAADSAFFPHDISADGGTVVGVLDGGDVSLIWQGVTGFVDAGTLLGDASAVLRGVSRDGRVMVGTSGERAFRWTRARGMDWLPTIDGQPSSAHDVSADGRVTVGASASEPVIWIEDGAPRRLDSDGEPGPYRAVSASADGRAVTGIVFGETTGTFLWKASTGIVDLGDVSGVNYWSFSHRAISGDGRTVCGEAVIDGQLGLAARLHPSPSCILYSVPVCWNETTGMVVLPLRPFEPDVLPGDCSATVIAYAGVDVSHDGSIVVGGINDRERGRVALLWDDGGPQAISDLLAEQGIDVAGWELTHASGVSADGETIVGTGVSPDGARSAWIAVVPRSP